MVRIRVPGVGADPGFLEVAELILVGIPGRVIDQAGGEPVLLLKGVAHAVAVGIRLDDEDPLVEGGLLLGVDSPQLEVMIAWLQPGEAGAEVRPQLPAIQDPLHPRQPVLGIDRSAPEQDRLAGEEDLVGRGIEDPDARRLSTHLEWVVIHVLGGGETVGDDDLEPAIAVRGAGNVSKSPPKLASAQPGGHHDPGLPSVGRVGEGMREIAAVPIVGFPGDDNVLVGSEAAPTLREEETDGRRRS